MKSHTSRLHKKDRGSFNFRRESSASRQKAAFVDNRPEMIAQMKLQEMADNSPKIQKGLQFKERIDQRTQIQAGTSEPFGSVIQCQLQYITARNLKGKGYKTSYTVAQADRDLTKGIIDQPTYETLIKLINTPNNLPVFDSKEALIKYAKENNVENSPAIADTQSRDNVPEKSLPAPPQVSKWALHPNAKKKQGSPPPPRRTGKLPPHIKRNPRFKPASSNSRSTKNKWASHPNAKKKRDRSLAPPTELGLLKPVLVPWKNIPGKWETANNEGAKNSVYTLTAKGLHRYAPINEKRSQDEKWLKETTMKNVEDQQKKRINWSAVPSSQLEQWIEVTKEHTQKNIDISREGCQVIFLKEAELDLFRKCTFILSYEIEGTKIVLTCNQGMQIPASLVPIKGLHACDFILAGNTITNLHPGHKVDIVKNT